MSGGGTSARMLVIGDGPQRAPFRSGMNQDMLHVHSPNFRLALRHTLPGLASLALEAYIWL